MSEENEKKPWTLNPAPIIITLLIVVGIAVRILMLIFYYVANSGVFISWGGWGDVALNYNDVDSIFSGKWIWNRTELAYPPLSIYLLLFLRVASGGIFLLYVFYAFLLELISSLLFYLVLKKFEIPNRKLVFGLYLINPFIILNNVFSASNCGYHITDSFFLILLMLSLYYYPDEDKSKFYLLSGLTMCAKWFTLPAAPLFFIKYFFEKDWDELKKMVLFIGIPIIAFLISPILYLPNYLDLYYDWLSSSPGSRFAGIPLYIKIIPFIGLFILYFLFRLKKADLLEITFFSIILMFTIIFWSRQYVRFLTPLIIYGHLLTKKDILTIDFDLKITRIYVRFDNHLFTLALSIIGCGVALAIIIFLF